MDELECKDENVIRCDVEQLSNKPNFGGFREHRWDQSILTNISVKHSCSCCVCQAEWLEIA